MVRPEDDKIVVEIHMRKINVYNIVNFGVYYNKNRNIYLHKN